MKKLTPEDELVAQTEFLTLDELVKRDEILAERARSAGSAKELIKIMESMSLSPWSESIQKSLIYAINMLNTKLQVAIKGLNINKRPDNLIEVDLDVKECIAQMYESNDRLSQRIKSWSGMPGSYELKKVASFIDDAEKEVRKIKSIQKQPKVVANIIAKISDNFQK